MKRAFVALLLSASVSSAADPPRVDLYGDPLPAGAVARLGSLERLTKNLRGFHFAPDGKSFHATACGPAWVQFDAATGKRLRTVAFDGLEGSWPFVSADGSTAVVMQPGHTFRIVDVPTGKVRVTLPPWAWFESSFEPCSPNGRYFAAADKSRHLGTPQTLHVWDTHSGNSWPLAPQVSGVVQVWFSPDGSRLIAIGSWGTNCWDVVARKHLWSQSGPSHPDDRALFRPDGKAVIIARKHVAGYAVLDADTGTPAAGLKQPRNVTGFGHAIGFSPDGEELLGHVLVEGRLGTKFWNTTTGDWRDAPFTAPAGTLSPDGKTLLLTADRPRFDLLDVGTGRSLYPPAPRSGYVQNTADVAFDPTGDRVYTVDPESRVFTWDAANGKRVGVVNHRQPAPFGSTLSVRRDGAEFLLHARGDPVSGTYHLMRPDSDRVVRAIPYSEGDVPTPGWFQGSHLSSDGSQIRTTYYELRHHDGGWLSGHLVFRTWDARLGKVIGTKSARLHAPATSGKISHPGALSPDGRLASDGELVYDYDSAQLVGRFIHPNERPARTPCFSADGRFVAVRMHTVKSGATRPTGTGAGVGIRMPTRSDDHVPGQLPHVWVWDVLTGSVVGRVTVGADCMRLTPDGRFLVTLDATGVSAWDITSGRQVVHHRADPRILHFEGGGYTAALAVSNDGRRAATARFDGTALVWDMSGAYAAKAEPLTGMDLAEFADDPPEAQFARMWRLVDRPADAVPFLRDRVKSAVVTFTPPTADALRALAAELDDDDFATREAAERKLAELGELARPAMRDALRGTRSPEQRTRLTRLLTRLDTAPIFELRKHDAPLAWAVAALERIGTPEARDVIRVVASGPPASRLTREASAALERLK